jgi:hypothetical protein
MALGELGVSEIQAIGEDSPQGKKCELYYDRVVKEVLRTHEWSFATVNQSLANHSDDPPADWVYRFDFPPDCERVIKVYVDGSSRSDVPIEYELQLLNDKSGVTMLSDTEDLCLRYVTSEIPSAMWDSMFLDAVVWRLAEKLAVPLTRKGDLRSNAMQMYRVSLGTAIATDINERHPGGKRDPEAIKARV